MIDFKQIESVSGPSDFDPAAKKTLVPLQDFQPPFSTVRHAKDWVKAILQ
ncbi:hypothetical protein L288_09960 [Sphingobium quisquiliarum P25]|uniref:Uncharacterized protein n=1 Tax=Sphingobium quisquiliarum P25 TaxID=1329909 RepID=T0I6W7_9SPHN|nr:hypothetical protein L288_09960 [Sphingobium quisquiliarum P25]